jgi:hypothetical protein
MVALNPVRSSPPGRAPAAPATRQTPPRATLPAPNRPQSLQRARYYDPATGEFTSRDPLEYVDGMSPYRGYFAILGMDPFGEELVISPVDHRLSGGCRTERNRTLYQQWRFSFSYSFHDSKTQKSVKSETAPCDGFLVQEVTYTCAVGECTDTGCIRVHGEAEAFRYYEAWEFRFNEATPIVVKQASVDFTDRAHFAAIPDTWGFYTQSGEIRFVCKTPFRGRRGFGAVEGVDDTIRGWTPLTVGRRCPTSSGGLPASTIAPPWWGIASNPFDRLGDFRGDRDFRMFWNCCGRRNGVVGTARPSRSRTR